VKNQANGQVLAVSANKSDTQKDFLLQVTPGRDNSDSADCLLPLLKGLSQRLFSMRCVIFINLCESIWDVLIACCNSLHRIFQPMEVLFCRPETRRTRQPVGKKQEIAEVLLVRQ